MRCLSRTKTSLIIIRQPSLKKVAKTLLSINDKNKKPTLLQYANVYEWVWERESERDRERQVIW